MKKFIISLLTLAVTSCLSAFTLFDGSIGDSRIYPSTIHKYQISIPEGYDGQPACLFLGLDGVLCNAPAEIDSLIAEGSVPYIIGIYLQPGIVSAPDGPVLRYNRSNEFDATDARFSRFLETEVIPAAIDEAAKQDKTFILKDGGENRMIFGLSSGAVAAFTAAWHRPDLFGRIYAGCGTFVPMRGGNELQAIVRKHEPKPLRAFLQDGFSDTWNPLFGSWFEANQLLGSALEFAGYEYDFDWADGGHSIRRTSEIFPDVMRWLWRGYGAEREPRRTGNATVARILENAGGWVREAAADYEPHTGATYPDGTLKAAPADGSNCLVQTLVRPDGTEYASQPYYWLHTYNNSTLRKGGMAFDGNGYLWSATEAGIQVLDQAGRVRAIFDLPLELSIALANSPANILEGSSLEIRDGQIRLLTPQATYTRSLKVVAPKPGVTPESEGAA